MGSRLARALLIAVVLALAFVAGRWTARKDAPQAAREVSAPALGRGDFGPAHPAELGGERTEAGPGQVGAEAGPDPRTDRLAVVGSAGVIADADLGVLVYGRVMQSGGTPVPDCSVAFADEFGERRSSNSGPGGSYAVIGLTPGHWEVSYSSDIGQGKADPLEVTPGQPSIRRDLVIAAELTICVRFLAPDGRPFSAALHELGTSYHELRPVPVATRSAPPARLPDSTLRDYSDHGLGRYESELNPFRRSSLPDECDGMLLLREPPPLYVSAAARNVILATQLLDPGATELTFVLDPRAFLAHLASARLRVIDAGSGTPLEGARIELTDSQTGGGGTPTAADGTWRAERVPPGQLELRVECPGYAAHFGLVHVEPGIENDLGDVRLPPACALRGVIVDAGGAGIARLLSWRSYDPVTGRLSPARRRYHSSDAAGAFAIEDLPPEEIWITLGDAGAPCNPYVFDLRGGSIEGARLVVPTATRIIVRAHAPEPSDSGACVFGWSIRDGAGREVMGRAAARDWPVEFALTPGTYALVTTLDGAERERRAIEVGTETVKLSVRP